MRLSLDLGLGSVATTGGYVFTNAEAEALVARFSTPATNARKALIDTLVGGLKDGGVWSKLDALYVTAAADNQAARRNWIADQYNLIAASAPTFVADRGYSGDGASSYLATGYNPTTAASPKLTQNSASMGLWLRTNLPNGTGQSYEVGNATSYLARGSVAGGNLSRGRPNVSTDLTIGAAYPGHRAWTRGGASLWEAYASGTDDGGGTDASSALTNAEFRILSVTASLFGVNQVAAIHWGSNLSAAESLALYNALNTYLTAVGAA